MKPFPPRKETLHYEDYDLEVIGGARPSFADLYHVLLTVRWWAAFAFIVGAYLLLNAIFAALYRLVGGVANVDSFLDAFFFSVQTMGTIGYGAMAPVTRAANALVVLESITGLVVTALATGLVFVRFSRVRSKIRFSKHATISPHEGVPTLSLRIGNERLAPIVEANVRLHMTSTIRTREGTTHYKPFALALVNDRLPTLTSAMTLRHVIDATSPLAKDTPDTLAEGEVEFVLSLHGTDETSLQMVHTRNVWSYKRILWGMRLADVMEEVSSTRLVLDLRKFDDIIETEPTEGFPYPVSAPESDVSSSS